MARAQRLVQVRPFWWQLYSLSFGFCFARLLLYVQLGRVEEGAFQGEIQRAGLGALTSPLLVDVLTAAVLSAPVLLWSWRRAFRQAMGIVMAITQLSVSLLGFLHIRLILARGDGLGAAVIDDALRGGGISFAEMLEYGEIWDVAGVITCCLVPLVFGRTVTCGRYTWNAIQTSTFGLCLALGVLSPFCEQLPRPLRYNALAYLVRDAWGSSRFEQSSALAEDDRPIFGKMRLSMQGAQFVDKHKRDVPTLGTARPDDSWNVVFIVMESTGLPYVFKKAPGGKHKKPAMPFLKKLSQQSWWMNNHHSTSNSSHRSLFSIYSGLYPSFGRSIYELSDEVNVPTASEWLGERYHSFLMTAGSIETYFPGQLLSKTGLNDLVDRPLFERRSGKRVPKKNADFVMSGNFVERIATIKEPFFASYYSLVPHYPYRDLGPKYAISGPSTGKKGAYFNNLRALDEVIRSIVAGLKTSGRYERTIIFIVGDHGEAFGQHGFYTHANDLHEEQLSTPWLIHVPGAPPFATDEVTSHVDILPTLLDLLRINYDPVLLQGESMLQPERQRRAIFALGNEQSWATITQQGWKLIDIRRKNTCKAYDLRVDQAEGRPQPCSDHERALATLHQFASLQKRRLTTYSHSRKKQ